MTKDLLSLSIRQISARLSVGQISARELTEAYLARIDTYGGLLNCYITLNTDGALAQADEADKRTVRRSALDGIAVAIKDNIDVAGLDTSNGFGPRSGITADKDAGVIRNLREAGAVILGKMNMDEAALGATTDNSHYGRTKNPWRKGLTPGGSSGGAAAAVAARLCTAAIGTDTLGSIRIPAAYCGVSGFKPTYDLVNTLGVEPLYQPLDHVGPLCRSVDDLAMLMDVITRKDSGDLEPAAITDETAAWQIKEPDMSAVKVGIFDAFADVDADVWHTYALAVQNLRFSGVEISKLKPSEFDLAATRFAGFYLLKECLSARLENDLTDFPDVYSARLCNFLKRGPVDVDKLNKAGALIQKTRNFINKVFDQVDVIVLPTTPQTAFPFASKAPVNQADFTALANIAGCPSLTIPYGLSKSGLPVGVQIMGPLHEDQKVLSIGMAMESTAKFIFPQLPETRFDSSV